MYKNFTAKICMPSASSGCIQKFLRMMKITFFLLITTLIQVSAAGFAQKVTFTQKAVTLKQVFNKINEQTGYNVFCSSKLIKNSQKLDVNFNETPLEDVLSICLKGFSLTYSIEEKTIIIKEKEKPFFNSIINAIDVRGRVVDQKGQPLPGVGIKLKGTSVGSVTNSDGYYSIKLPNDNGTLIFSFVGFDSQEISVNSRSQIDVTLQETPSKLNEVVVIGFGTQKKITLTGAISSVGFADLVKSPNASVANTLAGRVTGLTSVQYSGLPGADDPRIYVRGIGSLTESNSSPLVLVDGVERSFSQLDPNEIETVTVLKDASATAVYGIRGANGVVIVTTKRGTEGTPTITMSSSAGLQAPTMLLDFADSYTYAINYNKAQLNDNPNANLKFSSEAIEAFRTNSDPLIYPNTDWRKMMLKPSAFQMQENINVSGGTKNVKYFVSLGYLNQDGLFNTFDLDYDYNFNYKRYNYRANIDIDVSKTTKISLITGGRSEVRNQPWFSNAPGLDLGALFRDINWAPPYSGAGIVNGKRIGSSTKYISGSKYDGLALSYGKGVNNMLGNILNFDIAVDQKLDFITNGLLFKIKAANNSRYDHNKGRSSSRAYYEPWRMKDIDPNAPNGNTIILKKIGADGLLGYSESFAKARDWYLEGSLSYRRDFGPHHVSSLLLYNQSKRYYPSVNIDIPLGYVGLAARATYDYKNKYLLDLNMGYNGSENFAIGNRFGLFPALSLGWILTEEKFMKSIPFINYLKLRGSYGVVGNDRQGNNRFLYLADSYSPNSGGYNFGTDVPTNQITAAEGRVGNPDVSWETARKQNLGLDMNLFEGKFGLSVDVFNEHRNNILTTRQTVPGFIAMNLPALNIGEVKNRGYEIEVKWNDNIRDLGYFISSNMSFSRNKVIFKDEISKKYDYLLETGQRVNQPFGYVFDGFWSENDVTRLSDFPNHLIMPKPGDMRYKDLNNDGKIDTYDIQPIGFPDYPEYIFGSTFGLNFKNFDLNMLWTATKNVSRLLSGTYRLAFGPTLDHALMQYMADGQWTPENAATATHPRMTLTGVSNNTRTSDFWQKDGSYIRLKNAELGYSFNTAALKRFGITGLRAYINGYNLLTFDKVKIIDPEASGAVGEYPIMKIYNMGVNINF